MIWSTQANIKRNSTTAVLLSSGNLILSNSSNSSEILWQSFDQPTDTFFPGAKLGWDKVTSLNRRIVSWKNMVDPATGVYRYEVDPSGVEQLLLARQDSSVPYWYSGAWNGKYFDSVPEMAKNVKWISKFVNIRIVALIVSHLRLWTARAPRSVDLDRVHAWCDDAVT